MGVPLQDIRGDIASKIPRLLAVGEREVNRRHIAGVVPVAGANDQRHDLPRLDADIFEGTQRNLLGSLRDTRGEAFDRRPATHLQRPGHAVATLGMRVGDAA